MTEPYLPLNTGLACTGQWGTKNRTCFVIIMRSPAEEFQLLGEILSTFSRIKQIDEQTDKHLKMTSFPLDIFF